VNNIKKNGILNGEINRVIGYMGHTDTLCVADCGLPISGNVEKIDLSVRIGMPSFSEVISEISKNMEVERITLANEIIDANQSVLESIKASFPKAEIVFVSHEELKAMSSKCKAIIRTGEANPYANAILHSGVIF